jgi:hypothetical protein
VKAGIAPGLLASRTTRGRVYFVVVPVEPAAPPDEDDPLGAVDEGDPLGAVDEGDPLDDGDEVAPDDEDPRGDAAGLPVAPALTPSLEAVSLSRRPVAFRPSFSWYSFRACWVLGPIIPSIAPGS